MINMHHDWGWPFLGFIWSVGFAGIFMEIFSSGKYPRVSTVLYVAMGWVSESLDPIYVSVCLSILINLSISLYTSIIQAIVLAIRPTLRNIPLEGMYWLAAGGLCYTGNAIYYIVSLV